MPTQDLIRTYESEKGAANYEIAALSYPEHVTKAIMEYLRKFNPSQTRRFAKMLDVGCGTGKSTMIFSSYFDSILGTDISSAMIEVAKQKNNNQNVEFQVGNGLMLPVEDNSIDLVTAASSVHFMDLDRYEKECRRVLKQNGVAAIYTWVFSAVCSANTEMVNCISIYRKFHEDCKVGPKCELFLNRYKGIFDQIMDETKTWNTDLYLVKKWTLADVRSLLNAYGDYVVYMERENPTTDPLDTFMNELKALLKLENVDEEKDVDIEVKFDIPMVFFHKTQT